MSETNCFFPFPNYCVSLVRAQSEAIDNITKRLGIGQARRGNVRLKWGMSTFLRCET